MSSKNTDSVDHEEDAASTTTGVGAVATAIKSASKAQIDGANSSPAIVTIAPPRRKNALVGYWEQKEEQAKAQKEAFVELRDSRATGTASAKQLYSINNTDKDKKDTRVVVFPPKPPENAIFRDGNEDASKDEVGEVVKDESKETVQTNSSIQVKDVSDHHDPTEEEADGDTVKEVEIAPSKGYSTKNSPVLDSSKNETVADAPNDSVEQVPKTEPNVSDLPVHVEVQRDDNRALNDAITTDQPTQSRRKRKGILCPLVILIVIVIAAIAALLGVFLGGSSNLQSPSQLDETSPSFMPSIPLIQQCAEKVSLEGQSLGLYHNDTLPPTVAIDGANAVWATESGQVFFYRLLEGDWVENTVFVADEQSVNAKTVPAVALSGKYAVVGFKYYKSANGTESGGVQVYKLNEATGSWVEDEVLVPSDKVFNSGFGWSVDIDAQQLRDPLVVVGAHLDNERTGAVYVFDLSNSRWSEVTKLVPEVCQKESLGYSVAVSGDFIVSSTDCAFNVLVYTYDRVSKRVYEQQRIRYVNSDFGPIDALVMNKNTLVYTTIFGGVIVYERFSDTQDFSYLQQIDFANNETETMSFPLSIDDDIFVVDVENKQHVFMPEDGKWVELLTIENNATVVQSDASEEYRSSVAVGGRDILVSNSNDIYHYDIEECADPMPTQSPTVPKPSLGVTPGLSNTIKPSVMPSTTPPQAGNVTCYELVVTVNFDANPFGTAWTLVEVKSDGTRAFVGSLYPYDNSLANQSHSESFCLPLQSTFEFTFYDSDKDGICCNDGQGSYTLTHNGEVFVEGGEFTEDTQQFSQQHTFTT